MLQLSLQDLEQTLECPDALEYGRYFLQYLQSTSRELAILQASTCFLSHLHFWFQLEQ